MSTVVIHAGPSEFLARSEPWLLLREDRHNLMLSLAHARAAARIRGDDAFYATIEDGGAVVGGALRTPPHKVLITDLPVEAGAPLASALAEAYGHIPAILGPAPAAESVAAAWVALRGGAWMPGLEQRLYRLDTVVPPRPAAGGLRVATKADTDLAVEWGRGFAKDAGVQFATSRASIKGWIERGALHVWEVDHVPVSITVAQGRTPKGVRVGYVYTPPEQRGRGYASACVAAVSQKMLDSGLHFCVLYTDLSNPTSNAIYQRIGYVPIADVRDIDLFDEAST